MKAADVFLVVDSVLYRGDLSAFEALGSHPIKSCRSGGGGIRTHGDIAATTVFKTVRLNHSRTPPKRNHMLMRYCEVGTIDLLPGKHFFMRYSRPLWSRIYNQS